MNRADIIRGIQERFRRRGQTLNELQRRQWAAREATALGRGGITIVCQALRMSPNTIKRGMRELSAAESGARKPELRIRRSGGGRKPKTLLSE